MRFTSQRVLSMLMGFAVLTTIPLRVEYLVQEKYGLQLSNEMVVLLIMVIPSLTRILGTQLWGRLFDRMDFIKLRIALNVCFILGTLIFFTTKSIWWLGMATMLFGVLEGGGMIIWNLWITKFSRPELVNTYMSMHTGTTGIRGLLAPFVGYQIFIHGDAEATKWTSTVLMIISITIFLSLRKNPRWNNSF